mgnify:CR=1 FL=1
MGQLHTIKVADLPYGKFRDKGIPVDNVSNFSSTVKLLTSDEISNSIGKTRMVIAITDDGFYKTIKKNLGGVENEG